MLARLPQVVEGGSEGYVVGILPAGGSWKVRRCDQAMTKQPFWFRDICRHTLYIYVCVVHAYTYAIICIDDTCMYISVYIYIHGSVWMSS